MLIQKLLENFMRFNLKQCQEIVDAIFGSEYDNSNVPILMPNSIQAHCYGYINAITYLDASWSTSAMNRGDMGIVAEYNVSCYNGVLTFSEPSFIGRDYDTNWTGTYVEPLADECERQLKAVLAGGVYQYYMYPDWAVYPRYTSATNVLMSQKSSGGIVSGDWIYSRMKKYNSENYYQAHYVNLAFTPVTVTDKGSGYVQVSTRGFIPASYAVAASNSAAFITRCSNTTFINRYIQDSGSENNYTYNYTTKNGDNVTVYYGDNYVIFNASDTAKINYNEQKDILDRVANQINIDTGSDIKIPTYDEVKYGPTPAADDDDIETDMPLSDAAFGEGLSHYYVTTVGSSVLEDISAAMSTWDITQTGKDLYKNLLSCRITKVGPIPAESSTFVIYGEELQYNGSPITISKITGNPSMDLGEYEILPKFNDFRDYAPFTKIEMFIPYCGWVALPSHVMSSEDNPKIITGTLLCDIIAGTCKAVIKCNDTVIAEASGFTAVDVPFTGENVGMKMAGIASSITSYGNQAAKTVGSVASGAMTGGAGAGAALAGGIVGMLGSYAQMYSAFNANYTEICGKTGDGCNVAGLASVFIKIQRPKTGGFSEPYYVPGNYAHTTGFMCMKSVQISDCRGLIVCANVDTSGISGATARERTEIKRLLETGIYVNLPDPEP